MSHRTPKKSTGRRPRPASKGPTAADPETRPDAVNVLADLRGRANAENVAGMARFGINTGNTLGISVTELRKIAAQILRGRKTETAWRHKLAADLWRSRVHEARILAALVDDPTLVTLAQMDTWVADLDSWDVCDQVCANLFDKTPLAWEAAMRWSADGREFVKRAGFALMAALAWHDADAPDDRFLPFLAAIEREADDDRNFVRKAVNWALRQIGKRNVALNARAIAVAGRIRDRESSGAARWVASDALRELTSDAVRARLGLPPNG